jgi:hypothetical protein
LGMDFHFGQPGLVPPGKTFITLLTWLGASSFSY